MPEIPLTLLKEKIIKTDIIIQLLADKNEQITQLREKLKMLYHKHVNKVKEYEELQIKIDLCNIEHGPLDRRLKEILQKYEDLQEQHQLLINSSEIRYQNKCMELEKQISNYNELLHQKQKCSTCHSISSKFASISKKYDKIHKELEALTGEYENSQNEIKTLKSSKVHVEEKYYSQLKTMKEGYRNETINLQNLVDTLKFSESKLNDEVLLLRNKLSIINQKRDDCNVKQRSEYYEDNVTTQQFNDNAEEWEYIKNLLKNEYVGKPLSPIISPLNNVNLTEVIGNEYIEDKNSSSKLIATDLEDSDRNYFSECEEDFIEDTAGCDEVEDIWFSNTTSSTSDKKTDVVNNCYNHSQDIIEKDNTMGNNCNENIENNLLKESEPITFDDNPKQICQEKVKSQKLCNDLDLNSIINTNFPKNSDFITKNEFNVSSNANLEIISGDNHSLEQKSDDFQISAHILQSNNLNVGNEENLDIVLTEKENQFKANNDVSQSMDHDIFNNLLSTEDMCNKSGDSNVINVETTCAPSTGTRSYEVLYLEYNEYLRKIRFQSKVEKYTPVFKAKDLTGFLVENCLVKETNKIPNAYNETSHIHIDNRENNAELVPFENETSMLIGKNMLQQPTLTSHDIGIQTERSFENDIVDVEPSGTSNTITKINMTKPSINKNISTLIFEHTTHIGKTFVNLLNDTLNSQRGSNEYFPYSEINGDFLGFVKRPSKIISKERPEVRVIRKRVGWKRMKAELFHSLVRYFNKKMKFNQSNFLRRGNGSTFSSNSKSARRLRMVRWKKLRELYLSSTDTDSDRTKKIRPVKKRSKCKIKLENNQSKQINEESCDNSEDEHIFGMIISEQRKYQRLFLERQELEDFYNTSVDSEVNINLNELAKESNEFSISKSINARTWQQDNALCITDKEDINSGDSGYIKSDSDNISITRAYKKRRISDFENDKHISNKKRAIVKCSSNETSGSNKNKRSCIVNCNCEQQKCRLVKTDTSNTANISFERSDDVYLTNEIQDSAGVSHGTKLQKKYITAEICSLLHSSSSEENEVPLDDTLKETFEINQCYLFGSDCESISTEADEDKSINTVTFDTKINGDKSEKHARSVSARVFEYDQTAAAMKQSCCNSMNKPLNQIRQPNHSASKNNITQTRKKPKSKIDSTPFSNELVPPKFQGTYDVEDPLHVRLQQESLQKIPHVKTVEAMPTSFKRSNSLKNRQTLVQTITQNIELNNTVIPPKEVNTLSAAAKKLHEEKAKALLQQVLTFPDKPSIINEVAEIFSTQDMTYISRIIILEVSLDTNKADTKYTPPAPVLTKTQRILLGLLVKLNQSQSPGILNIFIVEAEKYILTSTNLQCIENLTRLYLAVCKLERKIHRMRRMVCDAFYFMGDFSIPFLFTVLSTWIEVLPMESDIHGGIMVKVIIEIIKEKKSSSPGYNLIPLKSLLKAYYGYNMEDSCLDSLFLDIFHKYKVHQEKSLEYAIRILFKNLKSTWVTQKIEEYIKPAVENSENIVLKRNISNLIENISPKNQYTSG